MLKTRILQALIGLMMMPLSLMAQVTSGTISGTVRDLKGAGLQGATVEAVHEPSGTKYKTSSTKTGNFSLPGLRVGGPYKVTVTYVGFKTEVANDLTVQLGDPTVLEFAMADEKAQLSEVTVSTIANKRGALISKDRKGAGTNINKRIINSMPTLSRSITDITKLTPQGGGTSFAGQDNRAINFTLDGSIFNNSFGLQPLNGSQTNSTPISLDAIEEFQVNISPYALKDAGFTGASINAVTKSGTNSFHGTAFYNMRNEGLVGLKGGDGTQPIIANTFDVKQFGASFGGPIIKNKLFFFANYEGERRTDPGTTNLALRPGQTPGGSITSVPVDSLIKFADILRNKYGYNAGSFENYSFETVSDKGVLRLDWNISDKHKLSIRGNILVSKRDVSVSNSNTVGGNRNGVNSMAFSNTTYEINNNIYGVIAQLNSRFSNKISNELTFGYTANRDFRAVKGGMFPTIDIQNGSGVTQMTAGNDPFTPNNKLNTDTWQLSDNLTIYAGKNTISAGFALESFTFLNGFTPRINGIYTFANLNDFRLATEGTTVPLRGYSATWSNLPGGGAWFATTKARSLGFYVQHDAEINKNFNLTYGVRFDIPYFSGSGFVNTEVDGMSFVNELGQSTKLSTSKLPSAKLMISPRIGFNYDIDGDKRTQFRGGMGLFTGRPPFVFISNQVGNNGVTNGDYNAGPTFGNGVTNGPTATQIPFVVTTPANPIVGFGLAPSVPGQPASSYNIATSEEDFRFPQVFRANLALDRKLFKDNDIVAGLEAIFTQSLSNIFYYNANLVPSASNFSGPDNRPRFAAVPTATINPLTNAFPTNASGASVVSTPSSATIRINSKLSDAIVMKSGPLGGGVQLTGKLEKPLKAQGFGWVIAYNFGATKDFINPGSIAASSWTGNRTVRGNNAPDLAFSDYDTRNRLITNVNYRTEIGKFAALQFSLFFESRNWGRVSYAYGGRDFNGDGVNGNDLMYIPKDINEMRSSMLFENFAVNGVTQTANAQYEAYEAYIQQDEYLRSRRGQYAERNGSLMPFVNRYDFSAVLELFKNVGKNRHTVQLRADIFNVGNLINPKMGVAVVQNTSTPVLFQGRDNTTGLPVFRMNTINNSINFSTYRKGTFVSDVWQAQFGIRYIF